jgi:hypothetical protein
MRCPNCSAEINDSATNCDFCGHVIAASSVAAAPPPAPSAPPPMPPAAESSPYAGVSATPASRPSASVNERNDDIPNHLVLSIVAAVLSLCTCWCIPLGIVAVVLSVMVNSKINAGDFAGARSFSTYAKIVSWITIGFFVLAVGFQVFNYFANPEAFQAMIDAAQQRR